MAYFTIQSAGRISPPVFLLAPPALCKTLMLAFSAFQLRSVKVDNGARSEACNIKNYEVSIHTASRVYRFFGV